MTVSMDMSEVRSLGRHLSRAGTRLAPELEVLLSQHAPRIAAQARANAPKDRPWLSTERGIVVQRRKPLTRTILSPFDTTRRGKPQSVGYRVEYGTSVMPPRPFLGPALSQGRDAFNRDALAILVSVTL